MPTVKHRCPNPGCTVVLTILRQTKWHRVRCTKCSEIFPVPPTKHSAEPEIQRPAA